METKNILAALQGYIETTAPTAVTSEFWSVDKEDNEVKHFVFLGMNEPISAFPNAKIARILPLDANFEATNAADMRPYLFILPRQLEIIERSQLFSVLSIRRTGEKQSKSDPKKRYDTFQVNSYGVPPAEYFKGLELESMARQPLFLEAYEG